MRALMIFWKAVTLITDNLIPALRITGPVIVLLAVFAAFASQMIVDPMQQPMPGESMGRFVLVALIGAALYITAFIWMVVAWHRFVLLAERPTGLLPAFNGKAMLGYAWRTILVGFALLPIFLIVGLVISPMMLSGLSAGADMASFFVRGLMFQLVVGSLIGIVAYRIALILPARAIDRPLAMGEAWEKTSGSAGTMFMLGLITTLFYLLLALPQSFPMLSVDMSDPSAVTTMMEAQSGLMFQIYGLVVQWLTMLLGVSILSVLYGHYVEGRDIGV